MRPKEQTECMYVSKIKNTILAIHRTAVISHAHTVSIREYENNLYCLLCSPSPD